MVAIISDAAVERVAGEVDFAAAVTAAFISAAETESVSAPVLRTATATSGQGANIKFAAVDALVGLKVGTYWSGNAAYGLPNHDATTILLDAETGRPLAFVAARLLNRLRTAAGNAVAVAALARADAHVLAICGTGVQAEYEARAVARLRPLSEIRISGRDAGRSIALAERLAGVAPRVRSLPVATAVAGADLIVTATSSTAPLFAANLVPPGAHVSAMGADAAGKQELDPALLRRSRLFADLPVQSRAVGEFQHAPDCAIVALGDVLRGVTAGRRADDEITIFDSSGLALQDLFCAAAALAAARASGLALEIDF